MCVIVITIVFKYFSVVVFWLCCKVVFSPKICFTITTCNVRLMRGQSSNWHDSRVILYLCNHTLFARNFSVPTV